MPESERQPDQDHRLRSGSRLRAERRDARHVRHARVHGARGRPLRPHRLRHRPVERRRHLLRPVSRTDALFTYSFHLPNHPFCSELYRFCVRLRVGCVDEVNLRRARLVLGWVTVFGGHASSVCNQPPRPIQPPPLSGWEMSTCSREVGANIGGIAFD